MNRTLPAFLGLIVLLIAIATPSPAWSKTVKLKRCGYVGKVKGVRVGVQTYRISCRIPTCIAKSRYKKHRKRCKSKKRISKSKGWKCNRSSLLTCRRWTRKSVKFFRFCLSRRVKGRFGRNLKLCKYNRVRLTRPSGSSKSTPLPNQPHYGPLPDQGSDIAITTPAATQPSDAFSYSHQSDPDRTVVTDSEGGFLATFTNGSRTVTLKGPERVFTEPNVEDPVVTTIWVRVLSEPFNGEVNRELLSQMLNDTSPDILQIGMQYIQDAQPIYNGEGLKIAGDANYGPLQEDGTRAKGSDFNDYLGIPWVYGADVDQPESDQIDSLDCSGFVRMVFGYRSGLPLSITAQGGSIPRRSFQILDSALGVITEPNSGLKISDFSTLQPGDLVFFDASTEDGDQIDHVGIYLSLDSGGNHRFLSSRKTVDGPTLGDTAGKSILNGNGYYASAFRAIRRL